MLLTLENYKTGFLVDEELLAGVTEHPEKPGTFVAFILKHVSGEYVGFQEFTNPEEALAMIAKVERQWQFQPLSVCSGGCGGCGGHEEGEEHEHGGCGGGGCCGGEGHGEEEGGGHGGHGHGGGGCCGGH